MRFQEPLRRTRPNDHGRREIIGEARERLRLRAAAGARAPGAGNASITWLGVLSREHPWAESDDTGLIDLVLGKGMLRLVIECRRARNATWVFLTPAAAPPTSRFRCQWSQGGRNDAGLVGWDDFLLAPEGPEAEFCVIRGSGEDDRSLLEQIAGVLVKSLAPLASQELTTVAWRDGYHEFIHIPAIVTTATIQLCRYDPGSVDLDRGVLGNASFQAVPFIRFRKRLAHAPTPCASIADIGAIAQDKGTVCSNCERHRPARPADDVGYPGTRRISRCTLGSDPQVAEPPSLKARALRPLCIEMRCDLQPCPSQSHSQALKPPPRADRAQCPMRMLLLPCDLFSD